MADRMRIPVIAWREFRHTALTRAFIFGAIVFPLVMMILLPVGMLWFQPSRTPLVGTVSVIDPTGEILEAAREILSSDPRTEPAGHDAAGLPPDMEAVQALAEALEADIESHRVTLVPSESPPRDRVRDGTLLAYVMLDEASLEPDPLDEVNVLELYVRPGLPAAHILVLERTFRDAVVQARLRRAGRDPDVVQALLRAPRAVTKRLKVEGGEVRESVVAKTLIPIAFMMLLWIATFSSGNYLLTSTIEEKSNRVIEVLLSAVSPLQLLGGKILGYAGVSLVMLVMYGGLGIVAMVALAQADLVPWSHLVLLAILFVMAYLMIAAMMAGIGSAVSELHDAQSLLGPAMLVLMVPLILWWPIAEQPNGLLATTSSFLPPLIPFVLILRITATTEPIPLWQIVLAIIGGYAAAGMMIWAAARIFRVGILMQGKPPTPLLLLKWIRSA